MIKKSRTVLGFKPAHGLQHAGEAGPRAVAWRPPTQPNNHQARSARAQHGARAPPVGTTRWPRARRQAGMAVGIQPGNEVRGIRWGQLTREEGEVPGKAEPVGTHQGDGTTTGRRGRLGAAMHGGVLTKEGVGSDIGELMQHRTWRGGDEQRGNWAENPGRRSSPRGHDGGNGGPASSEERPRRRCWHR
jgi:hypothetical protein